MVQAAAGAPHQLRSPIQGRQGSGSHRSMWPVVVLGILTAIFAWIWYRGSGEANGADSLGQDHEQVVTETEQQREPAPRESELSAADPGGCEPNSSKREAPRPRPQENNPNVNRRRKAQQSKQQVTEKGLCDTPSSAAADTNSPPNVQAEASVAHQQYGAPIQGKLQGHVQEGKNDVPKKELPGDIKEHPTDRPRKREHRTDVPKKGKLQAHLQDNLADIPKKEELQADLKEHCPDVPKKEKQQADVQGHPAVVPKKEKQQADIQGHPADVTNREKQQANEKEHPAVVPKKEKKQADIQGHPADVTKREKQQADVKEHPAVVPKKEKQQADVPKKEKQQADLKEHPADVPKKEKQQADLKELPSVVPKKDKQQADLKEHPADVPKKVELQADVMEHPKEVPKKEKKQADIQRHLADVTKKEKQQADLKEHRADVTKKEKQQADVQGQPAVVPKKEKQQADVQGHPAVVPKKEKQKADVQGHPADDTKREKQQADVKEHPAVVPKKKQQADLKEHPADVPKKEKQQADVPKKEMQQADLKEHPADVPKKEKRQADLKEHPAVVPKKEKQQADLQEHPVDVPKREDEQVNILEHQTSVPMKNSNLLEEHLEDLVQTNPEECNKAMLSKNEVHGGDVDLPPSDIPKTKEMLINGDKVYSSLKKGEQLGLGEAYPQDKLSKGLVQANREARSPTLMAKELEAQKLPDDSCHVSMSLPEDGASKTILHQNDHQDSTNGKVNRAKQAAANATGCLLGNTFVKNSINVLEAEETLNKDLYPEMVNTSSDSNAIVADQFLKHESVEKCEFKGVSMCSDDVKPTEGLQEDSDVFASSLKETTQEGLSNVLKLGTGPKTSTKKIASLGSPNTDEKNTFDCVSEANIHEMDNQKTRKVATIQPMPQNVNFAFKVHYITHSDSEIIAITGDHEKLGKWEAYVPLTCGNGGFWSHSITLPADTNLAWKFVMVENGKIKRWEECPNRFMKLAHDDIEGQLWWGYP